MKSLHNNKVQNISSQWLFFTKNMHDIFFLERLLSFPFMLANQIYYSWYFDKLLNTLYQRWLLQAGLKENSHEHLDEKRAKFVEIGSESHIHVMLFHHVNICVSGSCSNIWRMPDTIDPCNVSYYEACHKSSLFPLLFRDLVIFLFFWQRMKSKL